MSEQDWERDERSQSDAEQQTKFETNLFGWKGFFSILLFSIPFGISVLFLFRLFGIDSSRPGDSSSFESFIGFQIPIMFWFLGWVQQKLKPPVYRDVPTEIAQELGAFAGPHGKYKIVNSQKKYPIPLVRGLLIEIPGQFLKDVSMPAARWMVKFVVSRNETETRSAKWFIPAIVVSFLLVGMAIRLDGYWIHLSSVLVVGIFWLTDRLTWVQFFRSFSAMVSAQDIEPAREALRYAIRKQAEQPIYNKWMYSFSRFKRLLAVLEEKRSTG